MCGISGYLTYTNKVKDYLVKNTLNLMKRKDQIINLILNKKI